jgi:transcriptional regulator of acetoin/glycerol metabolism
MKRAQILSQGGMIEVSDLKLDRMLVEQSSSGPVEVSAEDLQAALNRYNGVVSRAAKSLGLSRQAFYRRMETHGLKTQSKL